MDAEVAREEMFSYSLVSNRFSCATSSAAKPASAIRSYNCAKGRICSARLRPFSVREMTTERASAPERRRFTNPFRCIAPTTLETVEASTLVCAARSVNFC